MPIKRDIVFEDLDRWSTYSGINTGEGPITRAPVGPEAGEIGTAGETLAEMAMGQKQYLLNTVKKKEAALEAAKATGDSAAIDRARRELLRAIDDAVGTLQKQTGTEGLTAGENIGLNARKTELQQEGPIQETGATGGPSGEFLPEPAPSLPGSIIVPGGRGTQRSPAEVISAPPDPSLEPTAAPVLAAPPAPVISSAGTGAVIGGTEVLDPNAAPVLGPATPGGGVTADTGPAEPGVSVSGTAVPSGTSTGSPETWWEKWSDPIMGGLGILSGLYGLKLSKDQRDLAGDALKANPWYSMAQAGDGVSGAVNAGAALTEAINTRVGVDLEKDPGWILAQRAAAATSADQPGGYSAMAASNASWQTYNDRVALQNQRIAALSTPAGAGFNPVGAYQTSGSLAGGANQLASQSLGSIGFGINRAAGGSMPPWLQTYLIQQGWS